MNYHILKKSISEQAKINYDTGVASVKKNEFEDAWPYLLKSVDQFGSAQDFTMQTKALLRLSLGLKSTSVLSTLSICFQILGGPLRFHLSG